MLKNNTVHTTYYLIGLFTGLCVTIIVLALIWHGDWPLSFLFVPPILASGWMLGKLTSLLYGDNSG